MKAGDIIFLTRRYNKPYYRIFLSYMIALLTKNKNQSLDEVKVHSAIIYSYNNVLYVRDMDKEGDTHYTLDEYIKEFKDRIEIKLAPYRFTKCDLEFFNTNCRNYKVKYDYKNTFFYQVIKSILHIFVGEDTSYQRMCSEDVQRQFNLIKKIFITPEKINPNELYSKVKNWRSNNG